MERDPLDQELDDLRAENRRLRAAFVETARMLDLEQLTGLSVESVRVLAGLGLIGGGQEKS